MKESELELVQIALGKREEYRIAQNIWNTIDSLSVSTGKYKYPKKADFDFYNMDESNYPFKVRLQAGPEKSKISFTSYFLGRLLVVNADGTYFVGEREGFANSDTLDSPEKLREGKIEDLEMFNQLLNFCVKQK